jgi:hypothetical protein
VWEDQDELEKESRKPIAAIETGADHLLLRFSKGLLEQRHRHSALSGVASRHFPSPGDSEV